jgi:hypothetical protein
LHAPHRPTSARCFAGIRFGLPQDGQFRTTDMTISCQPDPILTDCDAATTIKVGLSI